MSPATPLPRFPNLDQLKHQAKDLVRAYRDGDAEVAGEFAEALPRQIRADEAKLTLAQLVLARRYGFPSWPKLRLEVAGRQLCKAAWDRDVDGVRHVLDEEPGALHESGPHPMWGGEPKALHVATERGQVETVRLLLDRGADPNCGGYSTPLFLAAHWGHAEVAQLLIERGADVDIIAAAILCDVERATALLSETPSLATAPGPDGFPPLHTAGCPEIARMLIDHGARLDTVDDQDNTPLGSALARGQHGRDVAVFLLEQGASADACQLAALGNGAELERLIASDRAALTFMGKIGLNAVVGTPLHAAVHANEQSTVRLLLEHKADPNARASVGQTPLHLCDSAAVARLLFAAGADPNLTDEEHGTTPLTWAHVSIEISGESQQRRDLVRYLEEITGS